MTLDEIRTASAKHFGMAKADAKQVSETTPPQLTGEIERFAASLRASTPAFVAVIADKHGLYGWCSDGVRQKVAADGGSIAFGWTIWEWPGVMLTAEFHAVWRNEAGEMLDVTPKPGGEDRILFVPDSSCPQDFDFDERPRNRRVRLGADADRSAELQVIKEGLSVSQRRYEEARALRAGVPLDDWLKKKLRPDALAQAIDELIAICDAFDEHFDSLGASGHVAVDAKFKTLGLRRLRAQDRLKALLKAELSAA